MRSYIPELVEVEGMIKFEMADEHNISDIFELNNTTDLPLIIRKANDSEFEIEFIEQVLPTRKVRSIEKLFSCIIKRGYVSYIDGKLKYASITALPANKDYKSGIMEITMNGVQIHSNFNFSFTNVHDVELAFCNIIEYRMRKGQNVMDINNNLTALIGKCCEIVSKHIKAEGK
jgi:hypothetical protein